MRKTAQILSSLAIIPLFCGCAMFQKQPAEVQLANYQKILTSATQIGAMVDLRGNPGHRPAYEIALQAVESLRINGNYDSAKLMAALEKLPIKEFKGTSGAWQLTAGDIVLAWDAITTLFISPDKTPPWVKATLDGVSAGLTRALAASPTELNTATRKVTVPVPISK